MWKILRPEPHRPLLPKEKIDPTYKRLRWQVFFGIFIGYAGYYLVRKNFTMAMPELQELGFDKGMLGVALSANAIAYGISKFIMGGVSDRSSARKFLPLGLFLSATATLIAGTSLGNILYCVHVYPPISHWLVSGNGMASLRAGDDALVLA